MRARGIGRLIAATASVLVPAAAVASASVLVPAAAVAASARTAAATAHCTIRDDAISGVARSRVLARQGATVVYRVRGRSEDVWFGCRRGSATRTVIGPDDSFQMGGAEYGASTTLGFLRLAGRWVVAVHETGAPAFASCGKYNPMGPCPGVGEGLRAVDVGASRPGPTTVTHFTTNGYDGTGAGVELSFRRILLSPAGALVWLLRNAPFGPGPSVAPTLTIYGCALADGADGPTCTPAQLGTGDIDPTSLALAGTTLTWTAGGQPQSASLS